MNKIINFVKKHSYYYLTTQRYNTHFEKLEVVQKVRAQKYIYIIDRPILLDGLKIKLCQVKAKNPSLCPNQTLFRPNNIHNRVSGLTCIDIEEFEKRFTYNLNHERNVQNNYQADQNRNH